MNSRYGNIFLYLFVVIIPTMIGSFLFSMGAIEQNEENRLEEAKWIASVHQRNWDQFIAETVTTLEILSLTAETAIASPGKIQPLLEKSRQMDPRYGGIYLLDTNGKVLTGSNLFLMDSDLSDQEYIKEVSRTRDIIISNHQEILTNGQRVIGIGKPVINEDGKLVSIIVAHMRVDYVQNIMRMLTPDAKLSVLNSDDEVIMNIKMEGSSDFSDHNSFSISLDRLPWSVKVELPPRDIGEILKNASRPILLLLIISHILFLFIKYLKLKRQAQQEKKENELQKLELVGTLAASTAHEIRNPLTGIKGLIQLLSEKYASPQDQYYFSVINNEVSRINEIVSEFLILGKPTVQKPETIDLRSIIKDLEPLIISEANLNQVHFHSFLPDEPVMAACTKDQMKQVVLNLTKNAFESMESGGSLTIKLARLPDKCQLKIIDTGSGIPENQIEKIFNPFHTSKDTGTGLGLVVCRRILQSFGGEIFITSKVNKGTQVDISLPIQEKNTFV